MAAGPDGAGADRGGRGSGILAAAAALAAAGTAALAIASGAGWPAWALGAAAVLLVAGSAAAARRAGSASREQSGRLAALEAGAREAAAKFDTHRARVRATLEEAARRTEEEVRRARDAAAASDRAREEVLSNIGHELRTPLNAILGMAEVLVEGTAPGPLGDAARAVRRDGEALLEDLDAILDYAAVRSGGVRPEAAPFEVVPWIEESVRLWEPRAREKGVDLSFAAGEGLPGVASGDREILRRVVGILVSNALKFTVKGGVAVTLGGRPLEGGRNEIRVEVMDTGPGLPPGFADRMFQPFTQADRSASRSQGGLGLGLALAGELVRGMGGAIGAESTQWKGTVVRVSVPLVAAGPAPAPVPAPDLAGARVLIVDDNETFRKVMEQVLGRWGMRIRCASGGEEALAALEREDADLVLLDIHIPGMDGYEIARRIRARWPGGGGPRIAGMTAGSLPEVRARCFLAGMDSYFPKAYRVAEIRGAVERAYGGEAAGAAPPAADGGRPEAAGAMDHSVLEGLRSLQRGEGGPDLATQVIDLFLEDGARDLRALRASLAAGDGEGVRAAAHALRAPSGSVGAVSLLALCSEVEGLAREARVAEAGALLGRIEAEFARARADLLPRRRP